MKKDKELTKFGLLLRKNGIDYKEASAILKTPRRTIESWARGERKTNNKEGYPGVALVAIEYYLKLKKLKTVIGE